MRMAMTTMALALAGCSAADDPDNVPLKGEWDVSMKVVEVNAAGIDFSGDRLPKEFADLETQDTLCVEPRFATREAMEKDLDRHLDDACDIAEYEVGDRTIEGRGRCERMSRAGLDYQPSIRFRGEMTEEYYRMNVTLDGTANVPDLGPRDLRMAVRIEGRRTGDC